MALLLSILYIPIEADLTKFGVRCKAPRSTFIYRPQTTPVLFVAAGTRTRDLSLARREHYPRANRGRISPELPKINFFENKMADVKFHKVHDYGPARGLLFSFREPTWQFKIAICTGGVPSWDIIVIFQGTYRNLVLLRHISTHVTASRPIARQFTRLMEDNISYS